jgi:hypothetical protein
MISILDHHFSQLNELVTATKPSQVFITIQENINSILEKNNFKRLIHFDLYRLKLNFSFNMKYYGSNEFIKKITGELIDVSFPYPNNSYMTNRETYQNKLMDSHTFKGLYEFNGFGLLNDLVEMLELESIDINKPYKLEKRINRFIFLRFIEYWLRIPFKISNNNNNNSNVNVNVNDFLNEKIFKSYNLLILKKGNNFNNFFKETIFYDSEFNKIYKALKENQSIDIYKIYYKFFKNEPYKSLFKMSREVLDKSIGLTEKDLYSYKKLMNNKKELYKIFFDTKNFFKN